MGLGKKFQTEVGIIGNGGVWCCRQKCDCADEAFHVEMVNRVKCILERVMNLGFFFSFFLFFI